MTQAANKYRELEIRLHMGRACKCLTEEEDDDLLERMSDVWWQMTDLERDMANARAKRNNDEV